MTDRINAYLEVDTVGVGRQKRLEEIKDQLQDADGVEEAHVIWVGSEDE